MEFKIGQIFDGMYPPEAAIWCNENNAHIEAEDGKYIILQSPPPPPIPEPEEAKETHAESQA